MQCFLLVYLSDLTSAVEANAIRITAAHSFAIIYIFVIAWSISYDAR